MCRTTLNVGALAHHRGVGGSEEGGMMFWLLACKTAVPPASPVPAGPPPIELVDATEDALVPPPYTLVEVRAEGKVSVDGAVLPVVLPGRDGEPGVSEVIAALERVKLTNPNTPAVVLAVDAKTDFHAVRKTIYSSNKAGFTTFYLATQADPADPPGSWRGIRIDQSVQDPNDPNAPGGIIVGALDKSAIDAVILQNMNQIRYCYQRELAKQPGLAGEIVVKFVISGTGAVSKAEIKSSTMGSAAVENCITSRFLHWQFPAPKAGGIIIVSYPFILTPG
jgi:biopolymer transport protein ExbD